MKKIILLFTLLITTFGFSQTANKAIAWSGIITDNSGNVLANTNVMLKFSITQNGTPFFSEQHAKTTDANGFVNANIGEGTPLINNLSIVYFDTVDLKLKIEANSGSGFVTLSNEFFKAVPYAKGAETAREVADDVQVISLSDNIKFYVDGYQGEINQNGLKLADLAGTGTREVVADANGQLQRKPVQVKYLSISGAAFSNPEYTFYNNFGISRTNESSGIATSINTPIYLPHNAKITNIEFTFIDQSSVEGFSANILVNSLSSNSVSLASFDSNYTPNAAGFQTIAMSNLSHKVDNLNNYYYLNITSPSWHSYLALFFNKIVITYEE